MANQSKSKIHIGKIILFDENSDNRVKNPFPHITWVHKKINKDKFNLKQCLFGLHQLKSSIARSPLQYDCKTIAIIESEKTAIIMSLFIPEYLWMATGSKQNLKSELLEPIKKNIVVFLDKGEFADWNWAVNITGIYTNVL